MSEDLVIGFLVEGESDQAVVEALAVRLMKRKLGDREFFYNAVPMDGKSNLPWAHTIAVPMLEEDGYQHVIVVLDADTTHQGRAVHLRRNVEAMFARHQLGEDKVTVCLAVPAIEAWLLTAYEEHPDEVEDAKRKLCERLHVRTILPAQAAIAANKLDLDLARKRSQSFKEFADALTAIVDRLQKNASAA